MRALVAAQVISSLGSLMAAVALPWFALETTGSASRMALVTFGLLVACAFVAGLPWAASAGCLQAIVPELLGDDVAHVAQANAVLRTVDRFAYFAGPALGGALLPLIGAPAVLLLDAASFCASFALVALFVSAGPAPPAAAAGGWGVIARDGLLRALTGAGALSQAAFMGMTAAVPALAFAAYGRDPRVAGVLLAAWGGGAMAGGLAAYRLVATRDPRRLGAAGWAMQAAPLWLPPVAPPAWLAAAALAASGVANGIRVPPIAALTADRIPAPLRAETLTLISSLVLGAGFAALLAAGPALALAGASGLWVAIAAAQTLAAALFARGVSRP